MMSKNKNIKRLPISMSTAFMLLVALAVASMIGACIGLIIVKVITL